MLGPDGTNYPNRITYTSIEAPARITWSHGTPDSDTPHFQAEVTFEELATGTRVTMRTVLPTVDAYDQVKGYAIEGGRSSLLCLDEYVSRIDPVVWATRTEDDRLVN